MTNPNQHSNPNGNILSIVSDERFAELTGGIEKSQIHPFLVDMRSVGSGSVEVGEDTITLRAGNMENGALFPTLDVIGSGVVSTFRSFPGDKTTVDITQQSDDMEGIGTMQARLKVREGTQIQNEADFRLIPKTHWEAINIARAEIAKQKQAKVVTQAVKRGFLRRLHRAS